MTGSIATVPAAPPVLSARRRWAVLTVCASALFLVGLDTTIVTVGLPEIGTGIGIPGDRTAWVIDAYTVPFASLLITSGALADRFGRRRIFRIGLVVFGASSLVCAAAPTPEFLIVARAVQGVGASMLTPVALAIVVNAIPDPRERAQAIGVWGAMFGLSMAVGPVAGGALIAAFDWRAMFWINGPVVLAVLVLVSALVPESRATRPRRLDLPGQVLLALVLGSSVTLLIEAPRLGWAAPASVASAGVLLLAGTAFVLVESRRRQPLIDPGLFRRPAFSGAVVAAVAVFVACSATLLLTTLLLQNALGWAPLSAGAAMLPMALGAIAGAPLGGYLVARTGARLPLVLAGATLLLGGALLTGFAAATHPLPLLLVASLLIGTGVGVSGPPITNTAVSSLPPDRAGVAGGITSTARQVGTALGVALAGSPAGGLATGSPPAASFPGSLPGWILVVVCGAVVLATAAVVSGPAAAARSGARPVRTPDAGSPR
ncbi:DHA2 family efflux MFS transporter permease subunit [Leucobacter sp.]